MEPLGWLNAGSPLVIQTAAAADDDDDPEPGKVALWGTRAKNLPWIALWGTGEKGRKEVTKFQFVSPRTEKMANFFLVFEPNLTKP